MIEMQTYLHSSCQPPDCAGSNRLKTGQPFPDASLQTHDHHSIVLPAGIAAGPGC